MNDNSTEGEIKMIDIAYEEFGRLEEQIRNNEMSNREGFLDTWGFEDEYSHNHIEKNQVAFMRMANEYFKENNLPYVARLGCENIVVESVKNNKNQ